MTKLAFTPVVLVSSEPFDMKHAKHIHRAATHKLFFSGKANLKEGAKMQWRSQNKTLCGHSVEKHSEGCEQNGPLYTQKI